MTNLSLSKTIDCGSSITTIKSLQDQRTIVVFQKNRGLYLLNWQTMSLTPVSTSKRHDLVTLSMDANPHRKAIATSGVDSKVTITVWKHFLLIPYVIRIYKLVQYYLLFLSIPQHKKSSFTMIQY